MSASAALTLAYERGFDLVEVSAKSNPPIVKITDYGKFKYEKKKKEQESRQKTKTTETKVIQVKPNTGEGDLVIKAKNISKWLKEGHRVKLDLFLRGRSKYMEQDFLKERMERVLHFVSESYKIADGPKKSPKGLSCVLEKDSKKKKRCSRILKNYQSPWGRTSRRPPDTTEVRPLLKHLTKNHGQQNKQSIQQTNQRDQKRQTQSARQ